MAFRQQVTDLLRSQGEVYVESVANDHQVPVVSQRGLASVRRTAVICSHGPTSVGDVAAMYREIRPLRDDGRVDEIVLVTAAPLPADVRAELLRLPGLALLSLDQLSSAAMDFRSYLRGLIRQWSDRQDGIRRYHVRLRTTKGDDLEQSVRGWIEGQDTEPIAVLGSYGIGKSVFAAKVAHDLAEAHLANPSARVPILIRLGEIVHEQSLEGLLGSALTTGEVVGNFSFAVFQQLNATGRLVIFLDAFDEMKRGMTWEAFRYNLGELNRLVIGDSRVVLLGRPTAFLNDDEHRYALHGKRAFGGRYLREPGWPDYREITVALLDSAQITDCATSYLRYQAEVGKERNKLRVDQRIERLARQLHEPHIFDIATRPVQLRMLLEVLPGWRKSLQELGIATLYDDFIDRNITREAERPGRRRFSVRERRTFARELAWWMWGRSTAKTGTDTGRVGADEIPDELIDVFTTTGEDREVARRDLVSACFLDRRLGGDLVFPHRSFQEFLVADSIAARLLDRGKATMPELLPQITEEVSSFLGDLLGSNLPPQLDDLLRTYTGSLPWRVLRLWATTSGRQAEIWERADREVNHRDLYGEVKLPPWWSLVLTLGHCTKVFTRNPVPLLESRLADSGHFPQDAALHLYCLLLIAGTNNDSDLISRSLLAACRMGARRTVYPEDVPAGPHKVVAREMIRSSTRLTIVEPPKILIAALNRAKPFTRRGKRMLDIRGVHAPLLDVLRDYCTLEEAYDQSSMTRIGLHVPQEYAPTDWSFWEDVAAYQRDFGRWA